VQKQEVLEKLQEWLQQNVQRLSADEMAEGPFENDEDENFGDTWEEAASIIDANGGLKVTVAFGNASADNVNWEDGA